MYYYSIAGETREEGKPAPDNPRGRQNLMSNRYKNKVEFGCRLAPPLWSFPKGEITTANSDRQLSRREQKRYTVFLSRAMFSLMRRGRHWSQPEHNGMAPQMGFHRQRNRSIADSFTAPCFRPERHNQNVKRARGPIGSSTGFSKLLCP